VLPAAPFFIDVNHDYDDNFFGDRENAHSIRIHRERGTLLESERFDAASIAVENIQCPIMLISGGDDQLGPCTFYAKHILKRLDKYHSKIERMHLDYPEAGHFITIPYIPRKCDYFENGSWIKVGGTALADELASRDSWMRILEFLKK
jgi:pimeloyl-ACP methyl ester carboxylesterase